MTLQTLVFRYVLFAVLATVANLATQRLVFQTGDQPIHFIAAVGLGTLVGLVIKYVLDKRWIFNDLSAGLKAHSRKFSRYALLGVITTMIFWATETVFWLIWQTDGMRELGAVIGLSVGYIIKYNLDRRFVFNDSRLAAST